MLICGRSQHWVLPFGVPAALLCEAILHANNMRDIEQDRSAGISTLATVSLPQPAAVVTSTLFLKEKGQRHGRKTGRNTS